MDTSKFDKLVENIVEAVAENDASDETRMRLLRQMLAVSAEMNMDNFDDVLFHEYSKRLENKGLKTV